jgi:glucose dehydrogenase
MKTGRQGRSGILVTKTLVIAGEGGGLFAAHSGGSILRAFDKRTGDILSEFELPAHQTGVPMTYMLGGQQDIVVAVGARDDPAELVALTLP